MRTTAFAAITPLLNRQSDLNPANKWFRSQLWERTVLSLLAKVERLPPNLHNEIAGRVGGYINVARTAQDDATLIRFMEAAAEERAKVVKGLNQQPIRYGPLQRLLRRGVYRGWVYPTAT